MPDDLGKTKRNPKTESNLIIGVLDTGILLLEVLDHKFILSEYMYTLMLY